ncbi:MAG: T9SS type A sorting domain-containing protein [Crocinitomicaceae bacterium]
MRKIYLSLLLGVGLATTASAQGDNCGSAVSVTPGVYTANGPTTGAGASNFCFFGGAINADWYKYTPTCDGTIDITSEIEASLPDTRLSIHSGTCGTLTGCIDSDDDSGTGFTSKITGFPVTAGVTYYFEWDDRWDGSGFDWEFTFTPIAAPVTNITVSNITLSSADIDWDPSTGGETAWVVEWGPAGFTQGTGTIWNVTIASDTSIAGLLDGTTYDVYITPAPIDPCIPSVMTSFTTINSCPEPTGFTINGQNEDSLFVSWTAGGGETEWYIEYGPTGFTPGTGTPYTSLNNPDTITGVPFDQFFEIYIKAVCTVGDSSNWVGPLSFETFYQAPYIEFNNDCDTPFEDISGTGTYNFVADEDELGVTLPFTFLYQNVASNQITIGENGGVEFGTLTGDVNFSNTTVATANDGFYIMWDDMDGGDIYYQTLGTAPNRRFIIQWDDIPTWLGSNGGTYQMILFETSNEIKFRYQDTDFGSGSDNYGADATIGLAGPNQDVDVSFEQPYTDANPCINFYYTSCPKPTAFTDVYVGIDTVILSWTAGLSETEWEIEWGPAGFTPGTGSTMTTNNTQDTIPGLTQLTNYDFYVTAVCGVGDSSVLVGPVSVMTNPVCPGPTAITVDFVSADSAGISWTNVGSATTWNIQYGLSGFAIGSGTVITTTDNPDTLAGLTAGMVYDVYVQSDCGGPDTSLWEGPVQVLVPIVNDTICGAISIPLDGITYNYHNTGATSAGEPGTTPNNTIWFEFIAPASGAVRIGTCGSTFDTELEVFEGTDCNATLTSVGYADGNPFTVCNGSGPAGIVLCDLTPGNQYYFWVGPYSAGTFGVIPVFAEAIVYPETGTAVPTDVCEDNASLDLFTSISGNVSTDGQWYVTAVSAGNAIPSTVSVVGVDGGTYNFFYVDNNVCFADTVQTSVTVFEQPLVGTASPIDAGCNYGDVNLFDGLSGVIDLSGTWYDDSSNPLSGGSYSFNGEAAGTYNFHFIVDNGVCAADTSTVPVTVEDCTGIDENEISLGVYPNPTMDVVTISGINSNGVISVLDVQGNIILTNNVTTSEILKIDLSEFESGMYILRFTTENNITETRIVKM